jgi:hypothetical protein
MLLTTVGTLLTMPPAMRLIADDAISMADNASGCDIGEAIGNTDSYVTNGILDKITEDLDDDDDANVVGDTGDSTGRGICDGPGGIPSDAEHVALDAASEAVGDVASNAINGGDLSTAVPAAIITTGVIGAPGNASNDTSVRLLVMLARPVTTLPGMLPERCWQRLYGSCAKAR